MTDPIRPSGIYTRRTFLRLAGASALAAASGSVLAACGVGTSAPSQGAGGASATPGGASVSPGAATVGPSLAPVGGVFAPFVFEGYEGKEVLKQWYADNGITLNAKPIAEEPPEVVFTTPAGAEFDCSNVNQSKAQYYVELGISTEITTDEVPALKKMYPLFQDGEFWKIRDGVYNSVPIWWGPIGINTRPDRTPSGTVTSWEDVLKPEYKGRIATIDNAPNNVSTAAMANGINPATITPEQLNGPIKEWLTKLRPQLKIIAPSVGDHLNALTSGEVDLLIVGSSYYFNDAKKQGVDIEFITPVEGTYGFCDNVFIPPTSPNRANAIAYINALLEGDTAVAMAEQLSQLTSVDEVNQKVKPEVRSIYPADLEDYMANKLKFNRQHFNPDSGFALIKDWRALWDEIKTLPA